MASQTAVWAENLTTLHIFREESVSRTPEAWFRRKSDQNYEAPFFGPKITKQRKTVKLNSLETDNLYFF